MHEGAGSVRDLWYAQGTGVVQDVGEHHGTFWHDRSHLLLTSSAGQTLVYEWTPALF